MAHTPTLSHITMSPFDKAVFGCCFSRTFHVSEDGPEICLAGTGVPQQHCVSSDGTDAIQCSIILIENGIDWLLPTNAEGSVNNGRWKNACGSLTAACRVIVNRDAKQEAYPSRFLSLRKCPIYSSC